MITIDNEKFCGYELVSHISDESKGTYEGKDYSNRYIHTVTPQKDGSLLVNKYKVKTETYENIKTHFIPYVPVRVYFNRFGNVIDIQKV